MKGGFAHASNDEHAGEVVEIEVHYWIKEGKEGRTE